MRALFVLLAIQLVAGCAAPPSIQEPAPPAPTVTTALVVTVAYDESGIEKVVLSGSTVVSARKFGPYDAAKLKPGETVGFFFDADDAGGVMVCAEGRKRDGDVDVSGCGMFELKSGDVVTGTITMLDIE